MDPRWQGRICPPDNPADSEIQEKNDYFKKFEDVREAGALTLIERLRAVIRSR